MTLDDPVTIKMVMYVWLGYAVGIAIGSLASLLLAPTCAVLWERLMHWHWIRKSKLRLWWRMRP